MAQTQPKDNPPEARTGEQPNDDEVVKELVEAVAAVYFGTCRKLARMLNRRKPRSS